MIATAVMSGLLRDFTAVSGSLSAEESCTGTDAYLESLSIPSLLRKEAFLGQISLLSVLL